MRTLTSIGAALVGATAALALSSTAHAAGTAVEISHAFLQNPAGAAVIASITCDGGGTARATLTQGVVTGATVEPVACDGQPHDQALDIAGAFLPGTATATVTVEANSGTAGDTEQVTLS